MTWRACVLPPPPPYGHLCPASKGVAPCPHALPRRIATGSGRWIIVGLNDFGVINFIKGLLVIRTRWAIWGRAYLNHL